MKFRNFKLLLVPMCLNPDRSNVFNVSMFSFSIGQIVFSFSVLKICKCKVGGFEWFPFILGCSMFQYVPYSLVSKRCILCLNRKLEILDEQNNILLKNQSEVFSHCHHQNKTKNSCLRYCKRGYYLVMSNILCIKCKALVS